MPFLEEQLPTCIDYGSAFGESYAVDVVVTAADSTYTRLRHPYPVARYEVGFGNRDYEFAIGELIDLFHRCGGMFGGFRLPDRSDFSTNNYRDPPTIEDQPAVAIDAGAGTYQLTRWYGPPNVTTSARRRIRKPRAGTVLVGIRDAAGDVHQVTGWSVDTTTGIVTLPANNARGITNITQAAQAVITVGSSHGYTTGTSVVFSGVVGMTQINGLRADIVSTSSTTITVDIDSSGFSAYVSDGTVSNRPGTGEQVVAGCEFDIPVRFETDLSGMTYNDFQVMSTVINLVEILNPE